MARKFDLVAIGTGSGAASAAARCRQAGWTVAVVDHLPFGGTCALRGCDPKKVLVGAAQVTDWARQMKGRGVQFDALGMDWAELMRFKRTFTDPVPASREAGFRRSGIEPLHGQASFTGPRTLRVGDEEIEARAVLIATGAWPRRLGIPGEEHVTLSDQFLDLNSMPRRAVFIGGGYISFEFAHVAARAGAQAVILHRGQRPLAGFDPDLVALVLDHTRKMGLDVETETAVEAISQTPSGLEVQASTGGQKCTFMSDLVVHGAGRAPNVEALNLAAAGVQMSPAGIQVNEYLQSVSNPAVYAAGDVAASGGPPLTPVAAYEGGIAAENLLHGNHLKPAYMGIPTVVYTVPPLAAAGLSEATALDRGLKFRVHLEDTTRWYSSRRTAAACSGFKVLIQDQTDQILGAHLLGPEADELINVFALAIQMQLPAARLKSVIFAYPTHASDVAYML